MYFISIKNKLKINIFETLFFLFHLHRNCHDYVSDSWCLILIAELCNLPYIATILHPNPYACRFSSITDIIVTLLFRIICCMQKKKLYHKGMKTATLECIESLCVVLKLVNVVWTLWAWRPLIHHISFEHNKKFFVSITRKKLFSEGVDFLKVN